ncbi:ammonia-forming cytochrome c nitrite reductase subunit c552 [Rubinisphaera sp.]|uniref:ammonia-forming cytochrome c nitrite reductase subunit c552 n=2 Tax=Rubinisphaera TaxID=1649490 RepID=UPI000C0DD650|nr:ammonia-forming cytochrome c nitrite reductase subunit c552 [Rubinisphaera sp.]MBV08292.1 nitrite reductase [Rubinisphaera sp.]|tara:strand:+ start:10249 stop:11637 length:1389 start_codon:yes stop_codon:yes gene_type:complete
MDQNQKKPSFRMLLLTALVSGLTCFLVAALLMNIFERKQEGNQKVVRVVDLDDTITNPAVWGENYPQQYEDYLKTTDMKQTMYGGSEALPQIPTERDPRNVVTKSKLETIPQLKRMWAGYAFATDFREERGHAYMLTDQIHTKRQDVGQPGTCIHCHASTYTAMKKLGDGDLESGFHALNKMTYDEAKMHVNSPVACIDCHDPETMALRVTRPAFMEGIAKIKAMEGIEDYEVNTMATRQEMRSYVCGQCHVEYYFRGDEKTLTYPWTKGLTVDDAYAHYEEAGFKDWTHAETGAPMLKAQHPEFELWSQGTHSRRGVSCADCHMPYKRVGGKKVSDHQVRSPLLSINNACQTCHRIPEEELLEWTQSIQTKHRHLVDLALDSLVDLIDDLKAAQESGLQNERLESARQFQRKASFYVDYVEAENSSGFHASQETARILAESINFSRLGQLELVNKANPEAE